MIHLLQMEEEKLRNLSEAVKKVETEFGVSVLIFMSKEDRDRLAEDVEFARKMKTQLLNAIVPNAGRM